VQGGKGAQTNIKIPVDKTEGRWDQFQTGFCLTLCAARLWRSWIRVSSSTNYTWHQTLFYLPNNCWSSSSEGSCASGDLSSAEIAPNIHKQNPCWKTEVAPSSSLNCNPWPPYPWSSALWTARRGKCDCWRSKRQACSGREVGRTVELLKGIVQRKVRWVESSVNQWLVFSIQALDVYL
jgi:hypothetical protein